MIEFKTLSIKDFGCIKGVELSLDRQGLVLVQGENCDTNAADSNGAGKSTLFKALSWVLFGQTVDRLKGDDVINLQGKKAEVELSLVAEGKAYSIVRTKARNASEKLKISHVNKKGKKSLGIRTLKDSQKALEEILGLDWLAFKNTVLYGQGDVLHFADPRTTDAQRKSVLTKILRLERIEDARIIARNRKNEAVAKQSKLEGEVSVFRGQLSTLETDDLRIKEQQWDERREERSRSVFAEIHDIESDLEDVEIEKRRIEDYRHRLDKVQVIIDEYQEYSDKLDSLRQDQIRFDAEIINLRGQSSRIDESIKDVDKRISAFEKGECPVCGTLSNSVHIKRTVKNLEKKLNSYVKSINKNTDAEEEIRKKQQEIQEDIDSIKETIVDWDRWRKTAVQITDRINEGKIAIGKEDALKNALGKAQKDLERVKNEPNPYSEQIRKHEQQIRDLKTNIIKKQTEIKQLESDIDICSFWSDGFGPSGLSSYLMDSVVPVVSVQANKYLEILSDGDLRIKLSTLTQLKGGSIRDKLEFTAVIEGQENVPMSGGQLKKVTLATDLALMDLLAKREGSAVDLLLLDEVLDGLDASGRSRVMELLEHLRSHRATIIVISHDPEIVEKFGKTINVVKKHGIASLV